MPFTSCVTTSSIHPLLVSVSNSVNEDDLNSTEGPQHLIIEATDSLDYKKSVRVLNSNIDVVHRMHTLSHKAEHRCLEYQYYSVHGQNTLHLSKFGRSKYKWVLSVKNMLQRVFEDTDESL